MGRGTRLRKEMEWRQRLARFGRAGTTVVEFCSREGVSTPAFYAWRKRLCGGNSILSPLEGVPDSLARRRGPFAPLRVTGGALGGSQVTVWLRGGTRLEIPLTDPEVVRTTLGVIFHADAEQAGDHAC